VAVVIAINAVVVASASAKKGEERPSFETMGAAFAMPEAVGVKVNKLTLEAEKNEEKKFPVGITCTEVNASGTVGPLWQSAILLEYTKCEVRLNNAPSTCTVKEPITFNLLGQLVYAKGTDMDVLYPANQPKFVGGDFVNFEIEPGCNALNAKNKPVSLSGEYKVKGSALTFIAPVGQEVEKLTLTATGKAEKAKFEVERTGNEENSGDLELIPPAGSGLKGIKKDGLILNLELIRPAKFSVTEMKKK
jgi:hypothetical protein